MQAFQQLIAAFAFIVTTTNRDSHNGESTDLLLYRYKFNQYLAANIRCQKSNAFIVYFEQNYIR